MISEIAIQVLLLHNSQPIFVFLLHKKHFPCYYPFDNWWFFLAFETDAGMLYLANFLSRYQLPINYSVKISRNFNCFISLHVFWQYKICELLIANPKNNKIKISIILEIYYVYYIFIFYHRISRLLSYFSYNFR